jgi:hypothetical protein
VGKDEKRRRKRPVLISFTKVPAPKRMPGGAQPLQPRYEKSDKPEGMAGEAPSKVELPPPKPGKAPDRSLSGHGVELGEPAQKKEEKPKEKPEVNVKRSLLVGTVSGLIIAGVLAAVFYHMGFFNLGGGGGTFDGTYYATVTTVTPIGTTSGSGTFTVTNGYVSDPGGTFTGNVDSDGYFVGTTIVSPGSPPMEMTGTFSLTETFTIHGSSGNVSQTIVAHKK